jgi:hypothetical protein
MKTMIIKEMGIEIEMEIHHNNKIYAECEKDCPEGWEIATYPILQELRNNPKYREKLNLEITWEFVQNPDTFSKQAGRVARLYAPTSDRAGLYCGGVPSDSYDCLGVRYMRRLK